MSPAGASSRAAAPPLPPPGNLSDGAASVWRRLAPLVPPGKLTPATSDLFAMFCAQVATWWEASELVDAAGLLTAVAAELAVNPALAIRDRADQMTQKWARAFGLMPDEPAAPAGRPAGIRHLREA